MYIYGGNIVQICSVLILDLTGSVGITAVILIGITVNYDLGCGSYYRSSLNRIGLNRAGRNRTGRSRRLSGIGSTG